LGNLRWSALPAQDVSAAQAKALKTLCLTCQDPEWVVRYAGVVGLQGLATSAAETQTDICQTVSEHFEQMLKTESDLAVRARAHLALDQLHKG